jgi:hypothetical protein
MKRSLRGKAALIIAAPRGAMLRKIAKAKPQSEKQKDRRA